jgi:coatomer protein complex subunit alpha (xenin)
METERRRLVAESPENIIRNLELAAYFTHCTLAPSHIQLALRSAMGVFSKAGNHATGAVFARRLIDTNPSDAKVITQVCPLSFRLRLSLLPFALLSSVHDMIWAERKGIGSRAHRLAYWKPLTDSQARAVLSQGDRNPRDTHEIAYDHFTPFDICPASLSPIYQGSPSVVAAYTGAKYLPEYKNTICKVDEITQVGLPGSGLRSVV